MKAGKVSQQLGDAFPHLSSIVSRLLRYKYRQNSLNAMPLYFIEFLTRIECKIKWNEKGVMRRLFDI